MDLILSPEQLNIIKDSYYILGQDSVLELIKVFEAKKIEVTYKGMISYLEELHIKNKIEDVSKRAEHTIKKVEAVLPIPDNVVNLFGKSK